MNIEILKLHPEATVPTYGTDGAGCFDLYAIEAGFIPSWGRTIARTGLAFAVPAEHTLDVRSRSGLGFRHGIEAMTAEVKPFPGTLDSDYRGELLVLLFNHSDEPYGFMAGERIAQARITASPRVTFRVVEQLSATDRGDGAFGHTGR